MVPCVSAFPAAYDRRDLMPVGDDRQDLMRTADDRQDFPQPTAGRASYGEVAELHIGLFAEQIKAGYAIGTVIAG